MTAEQGRPMQNVKHSRSLFLLLSLLALVLFHPLFSVLPEPWSKWLGSGLFTVVALAGVWWATENRRHRWPAVALALPAIASLWVHAQLGPLASLAWTAFCIYTIVLLFKAVMRAGAPQLDRVFTAVSVYLLIGLTFSQLHLMVLELDPDSYRLPIERTGSGTIDMLYFSFVTIMTLGFGDIVPLSPFARTLTITESLIGVFFIAILIARLIALHEPPATDRGSGPAG